VNDQETEKNKPKTSKVGASSQVGARGRKFIKIYGGIEVELRQF
jgi:hypothetical protein